jgi:putative nucleotidyltransferase with HDIG domain
MAIPGPRNKVNKILMLALISFGIAFLYPAESLFYPLDFPLKGEVAREDIISPFPITISKSERELREERDDAAASIPIILEYNTELADSAKAHFEQFMDMADSMSTAIRSVLEDPVVERARKDSAVSSAADVILDAFPYINRPSVIAMIGSDEIRYAWITIRNILDSTIYFTGVLADMSLLPEGSSQSVVIKIGKREIFLIRNKLLDRSRAYLNYRSILRTLSQIDSFDVDNYYEFGRHFIFPNLSVNIPEMEARQMAAREDISPIKETILEGDIIVSAGSKITDRQQNILKEIYAQKEILADQKGWYRYYIPVLVRLLLVILVFSLLYLYLYYFRRQFYWSNPRILALFLIYALELILIYFVDTKLQLPIYLFPIAIFSMLVTILFDAELGLINTFKLALLLGILHRFNFPLVLIVIVVGTVASYSTSRVRQRSEFFKSVLYLSIAYVVLIYLIESFKISSSEEIVNYLGLGVFNAVLSPLLAIGILPIFESLFGLTTDITLLELSDLNRPVLKRLALEAPGTYHHSIIVGNLAENAAKAINANPLLARVGAYYHDIGKIEIPEYFVENQLGIKSRHETLTPTMSSIILASHVKKGRQLGEEADLPDEVLNFIEEHHGTMTMTYFMNKARELGDNRPDESDFRYPGPKPQTREAAIVMLADSVEAASRTLADPKPARLQNLVQNIINDRFQSGELEECPLTLGDLARIRESFVQILIGVFHQRVEYPKEEKVE